MPIATRNTTQAEPPEPVKVTKYETSTVSTKEEPIDSLLSHIEGMSWSVRYYSQLLSANDVPKPFDPSLAAAYQSYTVYTDFDLKVQDSLAFSLKEDPDAAEFDATGVAFVLPSTIVPNVGDVFLADIGDGREGFFSVTNQERKTIFRDSTYEITYALIAIDDATMKAQLDDKVVADRAYVVDRISEGLSPILTGEEEATYIWLQEADKRTFDVYIDQFWSNRINTFIVPGQDEILYDPNLVKFLRFTNNFSESNKLRETIDISVGQYPEFRSKTIWDALISNHPDTIKSVAKNPSIVSTWAFKGSQLFVSIYRHAIDSVVTMSDDTYDVDDKHRRKLLQPGREASIESTMYDSDGLHIETGSPDLRYGVEGDPVEIRRLVPILGVDTYVFSGAFYDGDRDQQSILELLTTQMIHGEAIDYAQLKAVADSSRYWTNIERFYYTPILITLMRYGVTNL